MVGCAERGGDLKELVSVHGGSDLMRHESCLLQRCYQLCYLLSVSHDNLYFLSLSNFSPDILCV